MPLTRLNDDDYRPSAWRGVKFWMADEEGRPVICRVSHEALEDHADRVHFQGTEIEVFEAYRELIEQVASDAYDAVRASMREAASLSLRRRSPE